MDKGLQNCRTEIHASQAVKEHRTADYVVDVERDFGGIDATVL